MKLLEKKRDELAKEYSLAKYPVQNIETRKDFTQDVNFARRMSHCQTFQDGFDAALKELEPVLKELVDSILSCDFVKQKEALQKYKQLIGEK